MNKYTNTPHYLFLKSQEAVSVDITDYVGHGFWAWAWFLDMGMVSEMNEYLIYLLP